MLQNILTCIKQIFCNWFKIYYFLEIYARAIEKEKMLIETSDINSCVEEMSKKRMSVGSVVEWLTHRTDDQHGLSSKPTCAILLCS